MGAAAPPVADQQKLLTLGQAQQASNSEDEEIDLGAPAASVCKAHSGGSDHFMSGCPKRARWAPKVMKVTDKAKFGLSIISDLSICCFKCHKCLCKSWMGRGVVGFNQNVEQKQINIPRTSQQCPEGT